MTLYSVLIDKYCLVYCGPERCNCRRGNLALKYESCPACAGHGQVGDYGIDGSDFFGPKVCPDCKGTGQVKSRDRWGRFIKEGYKKVKNKDNDPYGA
jgi:DnaJ-class molecular chaperone